MCPDWTWDDSIFAGAARYYEQGRLPYPPGLADAFTERLGADGTGRLLDVGCGPGSIALRLAARYRHVIGIDSDADMIAEAQRLAIDRQVVNATFVLGRAEALPMGYGMFDTITFAASFHWMERERVAAITRGMLLAGGAVVHVDTDRADVDTTSERYPPPPAAAIARCVRDYLGEQRRAGQSVGFVSPADEDDVWRGAGLAGPEVVRVPDGRVLDRTIDDVVAGTLSMSNSAPHLFGPRLDAFEADLRALLGAAASGGFFNVHVPDTILKVWRPRAVFYVGADRTEPPGT
ncbi:MAG TPA: class I SAM-dependent methyltransferase [Actinopolymorphaceae bacterium]